jgi:hypothetical protein
MQRILLKKYFLFTVGSVSHVKQLTTWLSRVLSNGPLKNKMAVFSTNGHNGFD